MKPQLHAWANWGNQVTLVKDTHRIVKGQDIGATTNVAVLEPDEAYALGKALINSALKAKLAADGQRTSDMADRLQAERALEEALR